MKKELQAQLDGLLSLGISEDSPQYQQLKSFLEEVDKHPKKDWNDPNVIESAQNAVTS
jgi:hypothetical protein